MIKKFNINNFEKILSHDELLSFWWEATIINHDIEYVYEDYVFEGYLDNLSKVTAIYKNRGRHEKNIVGEPTYEIRTGGPRSEYAFYVNYYYQYRRPAVMWPSERSLVANEFNYDVAHYPEESSVSPYTRFNFNDPHAFSRNERRPTSYSMYDFPSEKSTVPYKFLLIYWLESKASDSED